MRIPLIAAAVVAATLAAGVDTAAACSCVAEPARNKLARADGAFNGRLLDVTPAGQFEAVYRYRVGQVFKGRKRLHRGKIVKVRGGSNDGVCGLPQDTGSLWGLFVSRQDGHWAGNSCDAVSPAQLRRAARNASSSGADGPWDTCG